MPAKKSYNTLVEALQGLRRAGYIHDFNAQDHCLHCAELDLKLHPEQFEITEVHRFEGMSNPDDNTVLYAIESVGGVKGVLVDAYGPYAEAISPEMAQKLRNGRE